MVGSTSARATRYTVSLCCGPGVSSCYGAALADAWGLAVGLVFSKSYQTPRPARVVARGRDLQRPYRPFPPASIKASVNLPSSTQLRPRIRHTKSRGPHRQVEEERGLRGVNVPLHRLVHHLHGCAVPGEFIRHTRSGLRHSQVIRACHGRVFPHQYSLRRRSANDRGPTPPLPANLGMALYQIHHTLGIV